LCEAVAKEMRGLVEGWSKTLSSGNVCHAEKAEYDGWFTYVYKVRGKTKIQKAFSKMEKWF